MRMAVTTSPWPRLLSTPNADIGATGWSTITPYMMRSQSVSDRLRPGAELALLSLSKPFSFLETNLGCDGARQFESFQVRQFCALSAFAATTKVFRPVRSLRRLIAPTFDLFFRTGTEIHSECRFTQPVIDS